MSGRYNLAGRTAVVTGAASGIGRALAVALAERGCHVAIADVNEAGLTETAGLVGNRVRVSRHRLDVTDRAAVAALPAAVVAAHGGVDVVINNAGVAVGGTFDEVSETDFEWLFEVNFWGVVRMTRAFLPALRTRDEARLVNLSSLFGLIAPPGQTHYSASKFAVRGFSDSLRHELAGSRVGVTVVCPGGVATNIVQNSRTANDAPTEEERASRERFNKFLRMPPERAAAIILNAVERRRPRIVVGLDAKRIALVERLLPTSYWRVLQRQFA